MIARENYRNLKIEAIDLFCGAGGLSYGLREAGINIVAGIDLDPACKYAYETNNHTKFYQADITKLDIRGISELYTTGAIRLLAGCAPCQPFSSYSNGRDVKSDSKWGLLYHFARLIRELEPDLVTMENVPRVTKHAPYQEFVETLKVLGYEVDAQVVYCPDFGIPQSRKRFVLLASKLGKVFLEPMGGKTDSCLTTVRSAIGHLPLLSAGQAFNGDPLHKARTLTPINLKRIRASKPGGTWHDWPVELRADCHRREKGSSYKSVYSRMRWDAPSPTITTQCYNFGTGRFGHPEQDRGITLREAAILQTFPQKYVFLPHDMPVSFAKVGRLIGNAVPPKLGEAIGRSFINHVRHTRREP